MTDDVLAVKYSPDGRLLAIALLDTTVKIFFQDSLKFFLSLYGHKVSHTIDEGDEADQFIPLLITIPSSYYNLTCCLV